MAKRRRVYRRRFRRGRKRTYKRRKFTRRSRKGSWRPFGTRRSCSLVYCENITLDPAAGSVANYKFRTNSLYDPNYTGTGHQPYGFDTLATLYGRYMVTGAKITVTANPGTTVSTYGMGVKVTDDYSFNVTDPIALMEQPGYRYRLFTNGTQPATPRVTKGWSLRKFAGGQMNSDKYSATVDTNPNDGWIFAVTFFATAAGLDLSNTTFNVRIQYRARFWEPKELGQS